MGKVTKWFGIQLAGKALSVALGTPLITGLIMAVIAYVQGLPLAWGFFTVSGVAAFTSITLNQARAFAVAYNIENKLAFTGVQVGFAFNDKVERGYGMGISFRNEADIPMSFKVERSSAHLGGKVAVKIEEVVNGEIGPGMPAGYIVGVVPLEAQPNSILDGEIDCTIAFGRANKPNKTRRFRFRVVVNTDATGLAFAATPYAF